MADLAAVLQNPTLRNRKRNRPTPIIAPLIGAWTVVILAFIQHGFNGLESDIAQVETGLRADIAQVETGLESDITGLRGEVKELRSDINAVDKRLSVLIGILNLQREVDDAAEGRLNTLTPLDGYENTRTTRSTISGVIGPVWGDERPLSWIIGRSGVTSGH